MKNIRVSLILYILSALMIIFPIVVSTGNGFSLFHSKILTIIAFTFLIIGRILTVVKKTKEDKRVQWVSIGFTFGIFIALIEFIVR
ncbi:MAG: hypothetical protein N2B06_18695 [Clostridium sp.]